MSHKGKTEIGAIEFDKSVVHEQTEPCSINLTREVTPDDIKKYGQHFLEVFTEDDPDEPNDTFKYIDVVQHPDSPVLLKVKEGAGWVGILLGKEVTFTIFELEWSEDESPLRVLQLNEFDDVRALPKSQSRPEGNPLETAGTIGDAR